MCWLASPSIPSKNWTSSCPGIGASSTSETVRRLDRYILRATPPRSSPDANSANALLSVLAVIRVGMGHGPGGSQLGHGHGFGGSCQSAADACCTTGGNQGKRLKRRGKLKQVPFPKTANQEAENACPS